MSPNVLLRGREEGQRRLTKCGPQFRYLPNSDVVFSRWVGQGDTTVVDRIAILGNSGTGKSRLARILGERLGLPVVHLDRHFWQPGCKEPPRQKWIETHRRLIEDEKWILDGNYGSSMEERLEAADTAILLEASRSVSLLRVWRRSLTHLGRQRPDLGPGCPERGYPTRTSSTGSGAIPGRFAPSCLSALSASPVVAVPSSTSATEVRSGHSSGESPRR